ncbi:unnamed protein product [Peniophora sp. CBMAI 1063]|nr:unnamed protein product [Peniophora sp. CBMAI 1063]
MSNSSGHYSSSSSSGTRRFPAPIGSRRGAGAGAASTNADDPYSLNPPDGKRRPLYDREFSSATLAAALDSMVSGTDGQRTAQEDGQGRRHQSTLQLSQQQQQVQQSQQQQQHPPQTRPPNLHHAFSTPSSSSTHDGHVLPHAVSFPGASPYVSTPSGYGSRAAYAPYPMSRVSYGYPMEQGVPHVTYSSGGMMPVIHAPIYPSYEGGSQPMPFTSNAAQSMPIYASSPPLSPHPSSARPHRSSSFQSNATYGFGTQYSYPPPQPPPPQYGRSPPLYPSFGGSPYGQAYGGSNVDEGQNGTWWFLPNSSTSFEQPSFQSPFYGQHGGGGQQQQQQQPSQQQAHQSPHGASQPGPTSAAASSRRPQVPPPSHSRLASSQASTHEGALSPTSPSRSSANLASWRETSEVDANSPPVRQVYHPNPPAQRSEWVMWAGNVPSDATHNELWQFFNQPPPSDPGPSSAAAPVFAGVSSIFLISRSNCAFVNFESAAHLEAAVARFNGQPLRPLDPRCPRLVCRVRRRTDDLKAGVGGQRGMGMHARWVKEQRARGRREASGASPATSPEEEVTSRHSVISASDGESKFEAGSPHTNSSGSFGSSNSSFLRKYFPQRYFILKSLTQYDLDLSVQKGVWATQRHNEGILDQAFRTSKEVYLIFGVNKSGEFYGYARMTSGIQHQDEQGDRIPWASHPQGASSRSGDPPPSSASRTHILSPSDGRYEESPQPLSAAQDTKYPLSAAGPSSIRTRLSDPATLSAPPEIGRPHHRLSYGPTHPELSLNVPAIPPAISVPATKFELDTTAPARAVRSTAQSPESQSSEKDRELTPVAGDALKPERPDPVPLQSRDHTPEDAASAPENADPGDSWGRSFKIEWIRTDRLPFNRTRHLRNPWNHGREVKVSRDGTELEPGVGHALIEEWDRPPPSSPAIGATRPAARRGGRPAAPAPGTPS